VEGACSSVDIDELRAFLAVHAMGWTSKEYRREFARLFEPGWQAGNVIIAQSDWRPDVDWTQCGMVIEAMRAKGWRCDVEDNADEDLTARCIRDECSYESVGWPEPYTRMLAVAHALDWSGES